MQRWSFASAAILVATVAQLAAGTVLDWQQFEGKAFGARLVAYPAMMLALPAAWVLVARMRGIRSPVPWDATALVMWGFLVDVSGNTLDLYDTVLWWDDANHLFNWLTLTLGVGICLARARVRPRWMLAVAVAGSGALLAVAWELGEWYTFIRRGVELATAYEDTLGDLALGSLGGIIAALGVWWHDARSAGSRPLDGHALDEA